MTHIEADPYGPGMFSKAGRFTSEKYIIFQRKDEILNNQRKVLKVTSLPHLKMEFEMNQAQRNNDGDTPKKFPSKESTKNLNETASPFAKQLARDEYYKVHTEKHPPPPCGFYNPKFDYVEHVPLNTVNYGKEKSKDLFKSTMTDFSVEEASRPLPDKLKKRVLGPLDFDKQADRGTLLSPNNHPHDKRFEMIVSPKNWGKIKKPLSVNMSKSLSRDYKSMFKSLEYSPDYDPNFEFGRKTLGSSGVKFEKRSPRKPMHFESSCTNEDWYDISKMEGNKYYRPVTTKFAKTSPRHFDEKCPLPSFMQKSINTRITVGTLNQKMLETNGFSDGKFQTIHSGFTKKKWI